jgi:hypothetical protein
VLKLREGTRKKNRGNKFETPFLQLGWISDKFDGSFGFKLLQTSLMAVLVSNSLDPRMISLLMCSLYREMPVPLDPVLTLDV